MKEIYLAGGCFWGVEQFLSLLYGVKETQVGYANGQTIRPSYEEVCRQNTGHVETVKVTYDEALCPLSWLLGEFFTIIDPTSLNRQGNDVGIQYRSGVYYVDEADGPVIHKALSILEKQYQKPLVVEVRPLLNYFPAEDYHQNYLVQNPRGYCHIDIEAFRRAKTARPTAFQKKDKRELRESLDDLQYRVTQENATEPPFHNPYNGEFREGIYVDVTTGQPLFVSTDKFESGCGWPSFSKPIGHDLIRERSDSSHGMVRTEVRSALGDAHLGHVFPDGPRGQGGLRYCINSASLRFVPKEEMRKEGYEAYLDLLP